HENLEKHRKFRDSHPADEPPPLDLPPDEDRITTWRRGVEAQEREFARQRAAEQRVTEVSRLRAEVAALRAEVNDLQRQLLSVVQAANAAVEGLQDLADERERGISKLVSEVHDVRLDLARAQSENAEARRQAAEARGTTLDLPNPIRSRELN